MGRPHRITSTHSIAQCMPWALICARCYGPTTENHPHPVGRVPEQINNTSKQERKESICLFADKYLIQTLLYNPGLWLSCFHVIFFFLIIITYSLKSCKLHLQTVELLRLILSCLRSYADEFYQGSSISFCLTGPFMIGFWNIKRARVNLVKSHWMQRGQTQTRGIMWRAHADRTTADWAESLSHYAATPQTCHCSYFLELRLHFPWNPLTSWPKKASKVILRSAVQRLDGIVEILSKASNPLQYPQPAL